jgi:hypothetical protein
MNAFDILPRALALTSDAGADNHLPRRGGGRAEDNPFENLPYVGMRIFHFICIGSGTN